MVKYVVGYDEMAEVIAETRADAEEYILSVAEEYAYEDYASEVLCYGMTAEEWFAEFRARAEDTADHRKRWGRKPYETLSGFLLTYFGEYYTIQEVGVLG